jgi:hypothetical protein
VPAPGPLQGWLHLDYDTAAAQNDPGVGFHAGSGRSVFLVGEPGLFAGPRLDHDFKPLGGKALHRVRNQGDAPFTR